MPASRQGTISANCLTFFGIRNTIAQISIPAATNDRIAAEPKLLALRDKNGSSDLVELLGVGALGAFDPAIESGGAREQNEQAQAALLAGLLELGANSEPPSTCRADGKRACAAADAREGVTHVWITIR